MVKNEPFQVLEATPITCMAFNKDRTRVALCPNNNEVYICEKKGNQWVRTDQVLVGHDQLVTGIDWAPNTNRIVTCAQDRNAYVWNEVNGEWVPTLVLLRVNRACTSVRWSPKEDKFAVGNGARMISVCNFEEENDWWVSRHIKANIRSTITSVAWHPNNTLLAGGSSDFQVRVFAAAVKGVDKKPEDTIWATGDKLRTFGAVLHEFASPNNGWVEDVAFSPSGEKLAWVSHGSAISFVNGSSPEAAQHLRLGGLPFKSLLYTSEDTVIAGGFDCAPILFKEQGGMWAQGDKIDEGKKKESAVNSAMAKFRQLDAKNQEAADDGLATVHQNFITQLRPITEAAGKVSRFASAGMDGKLVFWDL